MNAPAAANGEGRSGGMVRGLDRLFRTALVIIPIGVIGNVAFSLLVTERAILSTLVDLPRDYLWLAAVLGVVPWFTNAARLLIWTRFLDHDIGYGEAFRITLATDLGAAVSPTAVGGGFFKWGMLVQRGVSPGAAASLTTLAPIEDGVFFAIGLPVAIVLTASWGHPVLSRAADEFRASAPPVILVALAIGLVTWATVRFVLGGGLGRRTQRRGRRFLLRIRRGLRATWVDAREVYALIRYNGKARFALSLSLTAIQWICRYSIVSAIVAFLGAPVQPVLFWLLQWVVFTLATFIPTPGAAGGAEAAFFVIYAPFLPGEIAGLVTAGWRFFTFYLLLGLASVLYIALGGMRVKRPKAS